MFLVESLTYNELASEIILEPSLLALVDEQKLLNHGYQLSELQEIATNWILAGEETGYTD
jgi:hypothetical protein